MAAKRQFVDNGDDRSRGKGNNPFGNYVNPFTATPDHEHGFGPFAGDQAILSYKLYTDAKLSSPAGTATLVCQYDFSQEGTCDEAFQLNDGSALVGVGTFNFAATSFSLALSGGEGSYASVKGSVAAAPIPITTAVKAAKPVIPNFCVCRLLESQKLTFDLRPISKQAATSKLSVYSVASHEQFINNDDDEARGDNNNPFGTHTAKGSDKENTAGPFAGDATFFSFNLYADPLLKRKIGTASFACVYAFERNAVCHTTFQLEQGTLNGIGLIAFDATKFDLTVTGGFGGYADRIGDMKATPARKGAQLLQFDLDAG